MFCSHCGLPIPEGANFCPGCGNRLTGETPTAATAVIVEPVEYAGFWRRFVAYIIDRLILGIPAILIVLTFVVPSAIAIFRGCSEPERLPFLILSLICSWIWLGLALLAGYFLYFAFFECSAFQATPGKMVLGIIVTDHEGNRVSFLRALGRNGAKLLSHLMLHIGFILAGLTPKKQALHDLLADCLVVMKQPK
jgi:uncharacterized RDD family membrane protein YckC